LLLLAGADGIDGLIAGLLLLPLGGRGGWHFFQVYHVAILVKTVSTILIVTDHSTVTTVLIV
jgi:hypothetical protein